MTVWFDVEDLLRHREEGNPRVTGIQRLTLEIYRAALALGGVGFVRHGTGAHLLHLVDGNELIGRFDEVPAATPGTPARRVPAPLPAPPEQRRTPGQTLRAALDLQRRSWSGAGEFGAGVLTHLASGARRRAGRRGGPRATPGAFEALVRPGDTLLVLGSPWFQRDYSRFARWARDERRMRFGVLICDLVPLRHPEWCDLSLRRAFADWYRDVLPFCDLVLAISRYTAEDVEAFAREIGVALPRPVRALPIGSGFGAAPSRVEATPADYVLFVSTIEARKNHALMVEVWRRLLAERRDGVPELVFAGKIGWLVADLVAQLDATDWLRGRIRHVASPSDAALRELYAGALFTVFPSLFEGWGLPVTESLAFGVPCLCSGAASLPEAGGGLCRYFDPGSVADAYRAVTAVLDDRPGLEAWRTRVAAEFRPTPWSETARAVLDEADAVR